MRRFMLSLAAGLALCAGIASAEPNQGFGNGNIDPSNRQYVGLSRPDAHGQSRHAFGQAGAAFGSHAGARGSRAFVSQTGNNNSATINQRGNNKSATVIQRGNDTEVIINQHGDGPGGAWVVTW
ncbi:hypothetical protein A3731_00645 [Roseovarius sp. HI0049]|nr:hypothetical protein A3731_00645 [Roseovarius sp. HI0049]